MPYLDVSENDDFSQYSERFIFAIMLLLIEFFSYNKNELVSSFELIGINTIFQIS